MLAGSYWGKSIGAGVLLALPFALLAATLASGPANAADLPGTPFEIQGDADFNAEHGVIGGNGTADDPFIVGSWDIDCRVYDANWRNFQVQGTRAHFVVRDVRVLFCNKETPSIELINVTNATLENISFSAAGRGGLSISYSEGVEVHGGRFTDHVAGAIYVRNAKNITIDGIESGSNAIAAVEIYDSENVNVINSTFRADRWDAVECSATSGLVVTGNAFIGGAFTGTEGGDLEMADCPGAEVHNNTFYDTSIFLGFAAHAGFATVNITRDNTVDGRPIYYLVDQSNLTLDGVAVGQVILANCSNALLANLSFSHAGTAVLIYDSNGTLIRDNRFENNRMPISAGRAPLMTIYHNAFIGNGWQWDIQLNLGSGPGVTTDDGYPSGGNYWGNYTGVDRCRGALQDDCSAGDGIGDTPVACHFFVTPCPWAGDRYPLMTAPPPPPAPTPPPDPHPAVVSIDAPDHLDDPGTLEVRARVADADGVSRVEVVYVPVGASSASKMAMVRDASGTYVASVPAQQVGTLHFGVVVTDLAGHQTRYPAEGYRSARVSDLIVDPPPPGSWLVGPAVPAGLLLLAATSITLALFRLRHRGPKSG